jgi:hypothetical protein
MASICVWIFCFLVNPYDLYPKIPGLSQDKSVDLFWYLRLHRPYAVERIQPEGLIAGSSRAAELQPQPFKVIGDDVYNVSLPGATLREIRRMVEHAQVIKPQKFLLVSLDSPMFRTGYSDQMIQDEGDRYRRIDPSVMDRLHHFYQRLLDYWRSLYSVDAVIQSLRVLLGIEHSPTTYHEDGTWDINANGIQQPITLFSTLCKQIYAGEITGKTAPFEYEELSDLLDFTDAHGIHVILLISPMHGLLMQTLDMAGTWEDYLKWQRELVAVVGARKSDTQIFGIEDNRLLVLEALDSPNPVFQDGIHYSRRAGIEITKCLLGPCESALKPTRLNDSSISAYLQQVNELRTQYVRDNPELVAKARKWVGLAPSK